MGFKSGEYGGRNSRVAPACSMNSLVAGGMMERRIIHHNHMIIRQHRAEGMFQPVIKRQRVTRPFPQLSGLEGPLYLSR